MRLELTEEFGVQPALVTVIPVGINNAVPHTGLTPRDAKRKLGIREGERPSCFW